MNVDECMNPLSKVAAYGVLEQRVNADKIDQSIEELKINGFSLLSSDFSSDSVEKFSDCFYAANELYRKRFERSIKKCAGEKGVIRCLPFFDAAFFKILFNQPLHSLLSRLLGDYYICSQVNGLINEPNDSGFSQLPWHRDLPFRHLIFSRPIAINALYAVDDFTLENGCTQVIPGSHRNEEFCSIEAVSSLKKPVVCRAGDFIILDCMTYHSGTLNKSESSRRAINHVFTIPALRQQVHLPSIFGDASEFNDQEKKILGYGLDHPRSIEEWFSWQELKS
jgi:Phytanoyl-CoA dioxygenase (PhyH)